MRPALTVIGASFGSYNREKVVSIAGALEILHTATLVHDDIIDRSALRRGRTTVSEQYGMDLAVYTGDFLFTKAVLMLSKDITVDKLDVVAKSVKTICEGEVDQYQGKFDAGTSVLSYLKRINRKTAVLFGASCGLGAYAGDCGEEMARKLAKFGFYYGMAFQIRDDINDFVSKEDKQGKPVYKDLTEGVITLPAILSLKKNLAVKKSLEEIMGRKGSAGFKEISQLAEMIKESGGVNEAGRLLDKYVERGRKLLEAFPESVYKTMLLNLIGALRVQSL